ncbi:MAG: hypothetical protein IPJ20_19915 [Flammeovirgaceae bacterium]|nr:hypothetical protein [Flammeovirgaceae bacterium]
MDGTVGIQTLRAINGTDQEQLFNLLKIERKVFLNNIIEGSLIRLYSTMVG